jgi:hypothetical protein
LTDPHQVNSLTASAICECQKRHVFGPEEAKTMAKCIIEQLSDAGFTVAPNADNGTNKAEKAEVHRPGDASSPSSSGVGSIGTRGCRTEFRARANA